MPSPFGRRPWCVLACLPFISFIALAQPNPPAGPKSVNVEPHGIVVSYPQNWRALAAVIPISSRSQASSLRGPRARVKYPRSDLQ